MALALFIYHSCVTLLAMTLRQKRLVVAMVIANVVTILALMVLVTLSSAPTPERPPLGPPQPWGGGWPPLGPPQPWGGEWPPLGPPRQSRGRLPQPWGGGWPPQETCRWQATQLLAQAGMGGTVALIPDGSLRFEIASILAPDQTADETAQSVWTAFDVALALQEQKSECATFTQVEVTILAVRPSPSTRLPSAPPNLGGEDGRTGAHDEAHSSQTNTQISASVSAADLVAFSVGELSEEVTYNVSIMRNE